MSYREKFNIRYQIKIGQYKAVAEMYLKIILSKEIIIIILSTKDGDMVMNKNSQKLKIFK
jgi:hypothetical protein